MSGRHAIRFSETPWVAVSKLAREKRIVVQDRAVRLLQLDQGFQEDDWCRKSHVGYVVGGELELTYVERSETLQTGDGLILTAGEEGKHKAAAVRGPVTLFLVEPA